MKRAAFLAIVACGLPGLSCERHAWEETKVLHQHGAKHGDEAHPAPGARGAGQPAGGAGHDAPTKAEGGH